MTVAGINPRARCYEPCFAAKILAPHPTLTSDAALYRFNRLPGGSKLMDLANPSVAPPGAATQGVRPVGSSRSYRERNRDAIRAYAKVYREKNAAEIRRKAKEKKAWAAWREKLSPEKAAAIRLENRERTRRYWATPEGKAKRRSYRLANLDKIKARNAEYNARPEIVERNKAREAARYKDPDLRARVNAKKRELRAALTLHEKLERNRLARERYAADPIRNLRLRMSGAVRGSLTRGVKSSRWLVLVGYTVEELRQHLERQFLPKMGWHNMPKWHIDHIVPLASFKFESAADPEFKAAWSLTNLRPCWGSENLRKHAKREFLV